MCNIVQMINSNLSKLLVVLCLFAFSIQGVPARSDSGLVEQAHTQYAALLEQLRADYAALLDARIDFEQAESGPGSSTPEQADYADWIQQLSEQFASNCRELASHSPALIPADIPCGEFDLAYTSAAEIDTGNENSDGEQIAAAVSEFDKSLGDFDEKLLREQDRVKARRPQASAGDSGGGDGSDSGSGTGSGAEAGESENGATEGEQSGDQSEGQSNEQGGEQSNEQGSGASSGGDQDASGSRGGSSRSSAPPDTPDGHDDDVIARQLREAAEKETDPELKRKLWEEYKRYKEDL
jgi:hypothetical protein